MRFYSDNTSLKVQDGSEKDILIAARFMRSENQAKFADYMRTAAVKLNEMEPFSNAMTDLLTAIEDEVSRAKTAEALLETIVFGA